MLKLSPSTQNHRVYRDTKEAQMTHVYGAPRTLHEWCPKKQSDSFLTISCQRHDTTNYAD